MMVVTTAASAADKGLLTLQIENDVFAGVDEPYTNGTFLSYTLPMNALPGWARWTRRQLAGVIDAAAWQAGHGIGQRLFTPCDITDPNPPRDDIKQTYGVSESIWLGTTFHLNRAAQTGGLVTHMGELTGAHLIIWGEVDLWIPEADLDGMAIGLPTARLVKAPGIEHSMHLEAPDLLRAMSACSSRACHCEHQPVRRRGRGRATTRQ